MNPHGSPFSAAEDAILDDHRTRDPRTPWMAIRDAHFPHRSTESLKTRWRVLHPELVQKGASRGRPGRSAAAPLEPFNDRAEAEGWKREVRAASRALGEACYRLALRYDSRIAA